MKRLITTFALALMFATGAASAARDYRGGHYPQQGIDQRQYNQERRIERGFARGELTPREARWLAAEQRRIERLEWTLRRDGVFTRHERALVQNELDRLSDWIWRANHNWRRRG